MKKMQSLTQRESLIDDFDFDDFDFGEALRIFMIAYRCEYALNDEELLIERIKLASHSVPFARHGGNRDLLHAITVLIDGYEMACRDLDIKRDIKLIKEEAIIEFLTGNNNWLVDMYVELNELFFIPIEIY